MPTALAVGTTNTVYGPLTGETTASHVLYLCRRLVYTDGSGRHLWIYADGHITLTVAVDISVATPTA
jgi:hypothetical protein